MVVVLQLISGRSYARGGGGPSFCQKHTKPMTPKDTAITREAGFYAVKQSKEKTVHSQDAATKAREGLA